MTLAAGTLISTPVAGLGLQVLRTVLSDDGTTVIAQDLFKDDDPWSTPSASAPALVIGLTSSLPAGYSIGGQTNWGDRMARIVSGCTLGGNPSSLAVVNFYGRGMRPCDGKGYLLFLVPGPTIGLNYGQPGMLPNYAKIGLGGDA